MDDLHGLEWTTAPTAPAPATPQAEEKNDEFTGSPSDAFTPLLLQTLRTLDQEADALSAVASRAPIGTADGDEDEEPEWLSQAAETAKTILQGDALDWDERAATVQAALSPTVDSVDSAATAADASALAWLDAQLLPIIAHSFPHLERLVSSPSLVSEDRETYARELLAKRDLLVLREQQRSACAALPVSVRTMGVELRHEEVALHELRRASAKQARGYAGLHQQLELTKSAAEATSGAARTIVEDHERDVSLLLVELRKYAPSEVIAASEGRLSASLHHLTARKRRTQAEAAEHKKAVSAAARRSSSNVGGASSMLARVKSLSFSKRTERSVPSLAVERTSTSAGGRAREQKEGNAAEAFIVID